MSDNQIKSQISPKLILLDYKLKKTNKFYNKSKISSVCMYVYVYVYVLCICFMYMYIYMNMYKCMFIKWLEVNAHAYKKFDPFYTLIY